MIKKAKSARNAVLALGAAALVSLASTLAAAGPPSSGNSINIGGAGIDTSSADTALSTLRSSGTSLILGMTAAAREWFLAGSVAALLACALTFVFGRGKIEWGGKLIVGMAVIAGVSTFVAILTGISLTLQ